MLSTTQGKETSRPAVTFTLGIRSKNFGVVDAVTAGTRKNY